MNKSLPIVALVCASVALVGCENKTLSAAAIGAATGAVLGKSTGNHKDKRLWIGAAIGALAGAAVGGYMDRQEAMLKEELAGSGVEVIRDGDNIQLVLPSNITFSSNQSVISTSFDPSLDAIAKVMKEYDKTRISIDGFTDSTGDAAYNVKLSEKRADSVKSYLQTQGVDAPRMIVNGFGSSQPIASNDTSEGRSKNRRVEIHIIPNQA